MTTQEPWGRALRCAALARIARHVFTTRDLPLRSNPASWQEPARLLGLEAARIVRVRQVHGAQALVVRRHGPGLPAPEAHEADIVISDDPSVAVAVQVADCVPILLGDARTGAVAAVHAGWRGMAAAAPRNAVLTLERELGVRPADVLAALGPSIGPCCYVVGPDVRDAFAAAGHRAMINAWFAAVSPGALHLDLWRAAADQLREAGVPARQIHLAGLCTAHHLELFHSYRREGPGTGRLAAIIRPIG